MTQPQHGGKRAGAGRKPKDRTPASGEPKFDTAEAYLQAVVAGSIAADPVRVQAARTLIQYQRTKERAPKRSPPPKELEQRETLAVESAVADEFEKKAREIRAKHAKRRTQNDNS